MLHKVFILACVADERVVELLAAVGVVEHAQSILGMQPDPDRGPEDKGNSSNAQEHDHKCSRGNGNGHNAFKVFTLLFYISHSHGVGARDVTAESDVDIIAVDTLDTGEVCH